MTLLSQVKLLLAEDTGVRSFLETPAFEFCSAKCPKETMLNWKPKP